MTDSRVTRSLVQVLYQPSASTNVARAMVQVLSGGNAPRSIIRTAGSSRPVKTMQPDGTWVLLRAVE